MRRILHRLRHYRNVFGLARGMLLMALATVRPGHRVAMTIGDDPRPVHIRIGWSDVSVYDQVVHQREYDFGLPADVRTIVDVGANVGITSAWYAWRYPGCRIVAIEPETANFELLAANAVPRPEMTVVHAAVLPRPGRADVIDVGMGAWGFRVAGTGGDGPEPAAPDGGVVAAVPAITLDQVLRDHALGHVDLLKIDVEGAERDLFGGPTRFLDDVTAVAIELHDRFRPGCSRAFFTAVADFPVERWRGGNVLVAREASPSSTAYGAGHAVGNVDSRTRV